ncbi:MAG: ADP-ribosylglycohydrolase [Chloroflexi bacterium]|nr:ADP-ribosylglycohydrolase [Chloroflexota bacterium]
MTKLRSAIFGHAIGDALGLPVQFRPRDSFHITGMTGYGTFNMPSGSWSDDTSMTIATCDSIRINLGKVDPADIFKRFEDWYHRDFYTPFGQAYDIGRTTSAAMRAREGQGDYWSNGNGSLMRILPLAFTDADDALIEEVSALTHAHKISRKACVIYIRIARALINDDQYGLTYPEPFHRLENIASLEREEIKSSGFVVDSLEAAVWCLLTTDSYSECVLKAVNLGDDTDSIAAIAGGLAGIKYGFDTIPTDWLDALQAKDVIESCLF